jgi:endonuclease/exonuclease/phosphatase family metal-dependent hydrolase
MSNRTTIGAGLIAIIIVALAAYAYVSLDQNQTSETQTTKIATFNIQIFGKTKSDKPEVMAVPTKIVREFDIVLIQEIRDATEQTIPNFIQQINQANGASYSFTESPRLGRTTSKGSLRIHLQYPNSPIHPRLRLRLQRQQRCI